MISDRRAWLIIFVLATSLGCSGGPGSGGGGKSNDINPNSVTVSGCGQGICGQLECGAVTDSCGDYVDCGPCRYTSEVPTPIGRSPALAFGDRLYLAYLGRGGEEPAVHVARRNGPDDWISEQVAVTGYDDDSPVDLALGTDDKIWVSWVNASGDAMVATRDQTGMWPSETLVSSSSSIAAIAADGDKVAVLYDQNNELFVAERNGESWFPTSIVSAGAGAYFVNAALAVDDDTVYAAWFDAANSRLHFAMGSDQSFETFEVLETAGIPGQERNVSLVVRDGRPFVALGTDNQLYIGEIVDGEWRGDSVAGGHADRDNALVVRADGTFAAAYYTSNSLTFGDGASGLWATQSITGECDEGWVDAVLDDKGTIWIAYTCYESIEVLSKLGPFPADYGQTCEGIADQMCTTAADCREQGQEDVCLYYQYETTSGSTCTSAFACRSNWQTRLCGDATQDPDLVYACRDELTPLSCGFDASDNESGVDSPASCAQLLVRD